MADIPVLVVTGPVGVGKTTVAGAISDRLAEVPLSHAVVDMDWLRACYPRPSDDPFHERLGKRNLSRMWAEFRDAGAERLVLADVVSSAAKLDGYAEAIPGAKITIIRLDASIETLHSRLRQRESGDSLTWHLRRAEELRTVMAAAALEHHLFGTEDKVAEDIAEAILLRIGWVD